MAGMINIAGGLAAAGEALSKWGSDMALQKMKLDAESQQRVLENQMIADREEARYRRENSPEADANAARRSVAVARANALLKGDPDVLAADAATKANDIRSTALANADPDVSAANAAAKAAETTATTQARYDIENSPEARQAAIAKEIAVQAAGAQARQNVEYSDKGITGAAAREEALAKARFRAQQDAISPEQIASLERAAEAYYQFGTPMPTGGGRSAAYTRARDEALDTVATRLNITPDQQARKKTAFKEYEKMTLAMDNSPKIKAVNTAVQHLQVFEEVAQALDNGDLVLYNSLKNRYLEATGSPLPTNMEGAASIVGPEVASALVAGGGTGEERQAQVKALNDALSQHQLTGAIATRKRLIAGKVLAEEQAYKAATKDIPGTEPFRQKYLLPDTLTALEAGEKSDAAFKVKQAGVAAAPVTGAGIPITGAPLPTGPHGEELHTDGKSPPRYMYLDRVTKKWTEYQP